MMTRASVVAASLALISAMPVLCQAAPDTAVGSRFSHGDWELACDNTRTCRAAGYQSDNDTQAPVSVLLTRLAGPHQPVSAQLQLGNYSNDDLFAGLPSTLRLSMTIDGKSAGTVTMTRDNLVSDLSPAQVDAMMKALTGRGAVRWTVGKVKWELSGSGATATLLKMDELQGRVGTPGALVRKGTLPEAGVLPPVPTPAVNMATLPKEASTPITLSASQARSILKALQPTDACKSPADLGAPENVLTAYRFPSGQLLVSAQCWTAAYNTGDGYWLMRDKPPYDPVLITDSATDYSSGTITAAQKGRGLGDCWGEESWGWNGKMFQPTRVSSTGMCKLIAPGGAWELPTLVTSVRGSAAPKK
ncbi:MAG: DUF1176 domain-containing protein [Pseudomonadota bacterium]|nr:DUF1176 domain-containing protein [Pseudomonadota bacterium]